MNCATHNDVAAVAFCRTCGKPLCNQCIREVRGVIYCEACLAARMEGAAPAGAYATPPQNPYQTVDPNLGLRLPPPPQPSGPNPAVAGILSGFFPFGVGAVYCSQYAKGLAHLVIMVLLIIGVSSDSGGWVMHMIFGLGIGFFYIYQIIDSVGTAKALQMGEPVPDPFGLVSTFGGGAGAPSAAAAGGAVPHGVPAKIPVAAAVLIGLGVLFLINTAFDFSWNRYWPLILIVFGVYLFAKHWGLLGNYHPACVCERCRTRKLMGPAIMVTLGVLFLLDSVSVVNLGRTWPAILLVVGVVKLMQSNASHTGHVGPLPPGSSFPRTPPTPPPPSFTNPPPGPPPGNSTGDAPGPPPGNSTGDAPGPDPSSGEVRNV
jgi:hypothetical protein